MAKTTTAVPDAIAAIEATREVFGAHPEDVISPLDTAADAFEWLEELFSVIEEEAKKGKPFSVRIQRLAAAGKYLAMDLGGYVGARYEQFRDSIQAAGKGGAQ